MSDFDWIEQHDINPWEVYDAILFDIKPSEDDVIKYINMALNTHEITNRDAWGKRHPNRVLDIFHDKGYSYLRIDRERWLLQGNVEKYLDDNHVIKYSELVGNQLTESDDDGFEWARELIGYDFFDGTYHYINIKGLSNDDKCDIQQLILNHGVVWRSGGNNLKTEYCGYTNHGYIVKDGYLYRTERDAEEYESLVEEPIIHIDGTTLLPSNLNESGDEWDWARDIKPYIPFGYAKKGQKYNIVEKSQILYDALVSCDVDKLNIYYDSVEVEVIESTTNPYSSIFCGSDNYDIVDTLHLIFYGPDYENLGYFWVTEDMITLHPITDNLNESEDDGLEWIREVDPRPRIELSRLYDVYNDYIDEFLQAVEYSGENIRWYDGDLPTKANLSKDRERGSTVIEITEHGELHYWSDWDISYTTNELEKYPPMIKWPNIKNNINESEDDFDEMDWIRDTNPEDIDTITFFQHGKCYYMGKLINKDLGCIKFEKYDPKDTAHSYEDGRGLLQFGKYWYSPFYIEEKLKEKNLTLYDLEIEENLNLMESDEMDWIRDTEIPIQPGTMYRSSNDETLKHILKLIEDKFPEAIWRSGSKPTKFYPKEEVKRTAFTIVFEDNQELYYQFNKTKPNGDELNYQLIEL